MKQTRLIVFAKAPVPGHVKTRLVPPLMPEQAAALHAASLHDVVTRAVAAAPETRILYDNSPGAPSYFAEKFPALVRQPQARGDLGDRLGSAFADAFSGGMHQVVIIGSDSPTLPRAMLDDALSVAADHDVVLGPACDGGYYLVAMRRSAWPAARIMFRDIAWSTGDVLRQTLERAAAAELDVHLLPPWYDIDRVEDLSLAALHAEPASALRRMLDTLPEAVTSTLTTDLREPFVPPSRFGP